MLKNTSIRACVVLLVSIAVGQGWAVAQQTTRGEIDAQLDSLRSQKIGLEAQLQLLAGNSVPVLVGRIDRDGRFHVLDTKVTPTDLNNPFEMIVLPRSPKEFADDLAVQWMTGELTSEQVLRAIQAAQQGNRSGFVRDAVRLAVRDCLRDLRRVTGEIATLSAVRERLLAANPPNGGNVVRIGSGVLKDTRIPGSPRVGLFEIKRDGNRSQLTLTFGPELKQIGMEDSVDVANQTATYKFEVTLPIAVKGASKMRGKAKVDFRNNKVRSTFEEAFDPAANRWTPADPVINALEPDRSLAWGEEFPSDRKILSRRGQLVAGKGDNEAEISVNVPVGPGAAYTFELKAPDKNRLVLHVHGANDELIISKFTQKSGKAARVIERVFDNTQTYRIRVAGFGSDLPANFEVEVWEYWPFNGNVPPKSWAE